MFLVKLKYSTEALLCRSVFSSFNVNTNHLEILLNCRFSFGGWVLGVTFCFSKSSRVIVVELGI